MKIWVICQYYTPESGAPSARLSGFARIWKDFGQKVTILTGIPNHPSGDIPPDYIGKPHFFEEVLKGIRVKRHWLFITKHEGTLKRALNQLSFAASILYKNLKKNKDDLPDVIMVSSPSFFAACSAWILSKRYGVPFIFEVRDLWPGIFVEMGVLKKGVLLFILEKLELFLYKRAAAVVTVTRGFAENIAKRGIDPQKVFVITNGVADHEIKKALLPYEDGSIQKLRSEYSLNPMTKIVLYIGNHGQAQALGQVIETARLLMNRSDVQFLMVGNGADKRRLQNLARGIPNIQFLPNQTKERVWQFYALADISLVCLKDIPSFKTFIPSKMFEIMASQTPMVAALKGEGARILQKSGAAMIVPPEESDKVAKAITTLIENPDRMKEMGQAGRLFVTAHYQHSTLAKQYLGIFNQLMQKKG